jgi:hypothetical protein
MRGMAKAKRGRERTAQAGGSNCAQPARHCSERRRATGPR